MRNGIKVSRIILLPIGGASVIDQIEINPSIEFNISVAGPLMSLVLGGLFGILVIFMPPGLISYIVQYLFLINILLGLFNLLPAFPMDGGRVLRSYLQRRMNFYDATMITAKVSRYFMALIIIGTVVFVALPTGYSVYNKEIILIWDLIIVFFLYEGMRAEEDNVLIKRETAGLTIKDAVSRNYVVVGWNEKADRLYRLVKTKQEHIILTKSPEGTYCLVNIFNRKLISHSMPVSDLAVEMPNIQSSSTIVDAVSRIEANQFRVGAVLRGKKLLGIATGQHISALLALHMAGRSPSRKGFK
jgi:Zn-dependent protease